MTWLRLDEDIFDNPITYGLSHGAHGLLIKLLCMVKRHGHRGTMNRSNWDAKYISNRIGEPIDTVQSWLDSIEQTGFFIVSDDGVTVANWSKYQEDPTSAERQRTRRDRMSTVTDVTETSVTSRNVTMSRGQDRTGQDVTLQNRSEPPIPPKGGSRGRAKRSTVEYTDDFLAFWKSYPNKTAKQEAALAWEQTSGRRPDTQSIIDAIDRLSETPDWTKDGGQFIPHPATWLRRDGWEDQPREARTYVSPSDRAFNDAMDRFVSGQTKPLFEVKNGY